MIEVRQTDLPLPVAPAMSRCGILVKSWMTYLPFTSRPSGIGSLNLPCVNRSDSSVSRKPTVATFAFGISRPTRAMPGTGASIRMLGAAKASARSFWSSVMRRTLVPIPGSSVNWVTAGPGLISRTRASTLKLVSVSSIRFALAVRSPLSRAT